MDYLVTAYKEINKIVLCTVAPSDDQIEEVYAIACNTLKLLTKDENFFKAFDELAKRRESYPEKFKEITLLEHFVKFHIIETKVLKNAKLSENAINNLLSKATELLEYIKEPTPSKKQLLAHVSSLRDEACEIATDLHEKRKKAEDKKKLTERLLRYGYAIGGAIMIFADASAWAASIGLSAPGSAVSGAAGTVLITYGLTPK